MVKFIKYKILKGKEYNQMEKSGKTRLNYLILGILFFSVLSFLIVAGLIEDIKVGNNRFQAYGYIDNTDAPPLGSFPPTGPTNYTTSTRIDTIGGQYVTLTASSTEYNYLFIKANLSGYDSINSLNFSVIAGGNTNNENYHRLWYYDHSTSEWKNCTASRGNYYVGSWSIESCIFTGQDILNSFNQSNGIGYYMVQSDTNGTSLNIDYMSLGVDYINTFTIISPTNSQIFSEDVPTSRFNISTGFNMDTCYYNLGDGVNRTMNKLNSTSFNITNTTMNDGANNVTYICNISSAWSLTETESYSLTDVIGTFNDINYVFDNNYASSGDIDTGAGNAGLAYIWFNYSLPSQVGSANFKLKHGRDSNGNLTVFCQNTSGSNVYLGLASVGSATTQNFTVSSSCFNNDNTIRIMLNISDSSGSSAEAVSVFDGGLYYNSGGVWKYSNTVNFQVDSLNITRCRDLNIQRAYKLKNNIVPDSNECLIIRNSSLSLDGQNYSINGSGASSDDIVNNAISQGGNPVSNINISNLYIFKYNIPLYFNAISNLLLSNIRLNFYNTSNFGSSYGIWLENSNNISIRNSNFNLTAGNAGGTYASYLTNTFNVNSTHNIFNILNNSFYLDNANIISLNDTWNKNEFVSSGNLTRRWYLDIQVNGSSGYLSGATVNVYDKDNNLIISQLTNSTGQISRQEINEYFKNTSTTFYTPHTINISATGYASNSTTYNLSTSNNIDHKVTLILSNVYPSSILISPSNNTYSQSLTNTLICNQTDNDGNLKNSTVYLWYGNSLESSQTKNVTGYSNQTIFTNFAFLNQGTYKWNCYTCDTQSACIFATQNNTIKIDTTNPSINHTYSNNTNLSLASTNLTTNISDAIGIKNSTLNVYYNNGTIYNQTTLTNSEGTTSSVVGIVINFVDGVFKWFWNTFDWSGRSSNTQNNTINVDYNLPVITITSPVNLSATNNPNVVINYTATDTNLNSCWWTNNFGFTNNSINCAQNISEILSEGTYTYIIYANDSLGNIGSNSITFSVSLGGPAITLNYPASNAWINYKNNIEFNFTALDVDGIDTCKLYSNFTGTWAVNYTWNSISSGVEQTVSRNLSNGAYKWNVWCNDSLGTESENGNRTLYIDSVYPVLTNNTFYPAIVYKGNDTIIYVNATDNNINSVWLQINYTTDYQNITVTNKVGNQYNFTLDDSLINNFRNISWRWWANDSAGNTNYSSLNSFVMTNRNPYNVTIITQNNTYFNSDWKIINFTANDLDNDTLNYSVWYSSDAVIYSLKGSTTNNYFNLSGLNNTNQALNYYYIIANDSVLENSSNINILIADSINPSAEIIYPEASPSVICSLTNVLLNFTVNETNIDYCSFNVSSGGLLTTENTIIQGCSNLTNITFNNTLDFSTPTLYLSVFDLAGNSFTTQKLIRFYTGHSSCGGTPISPGGGGSSTTTIVTGEDYFCGDNICQNGKNGTLNRGETFYNCAEDCSQQFTIPNLDELVFNCFEESKQQQCIWTSNPGLFFLFGFIVLLFILSLLFEFGPTNSGVKRWIGGFRRRRK